MNFQKLKKGMSHHSLDVIDPKRIFHALNAAGAQTLLQLCRGEILNLPPPSQTLNNFFLPLFAAKLLRDLPGEEYHYEYNIKLDYPILVGDVVVTRITISKEPDPFAHKVYLDLRAEVNGNLVGTGEITGIFVPKQLTY